MNQIIQGDCLEVMATMPDNSDGTENSITEVDES